MVGGAMSGYWVIGSVASPMNPRIHMFYRLLGMKDGEQDRDESFCSRPMPYSPAVTFTIL